MAEAVSKRLALDANLPLDLAEGFPVAHDFREVCVERNYSLWLPPTAVQELTFIAEVGSDPKKRRLAVKALSNLLAWKIQPFDLEPVQHGYAERFSRLLRDRCLLPETEVNDGMILAETSLKGLPMLVTSDAHILDIEPVQLSVAFADRGLVPVTPMHPKPILKTLRGKR